jgi:glycosyltransferase involved in cell wall biosynthesis
METENPAVSVIMPAWNVQDYVVKSLDSVLSQEMRDFEIIFVNDGSTDDTLNIATEKLSNCGLPVVIVDQKNQGVSVARNVGLGKARGDYVVFFDADDIMKPGCLKRLYELAC